MTDKKSVRASMHIDVWVECPNCESDINLRDEADTNGHNHDEECGVLMQACPNGEHWSEAHQNFSVKGVVCTQCKHEFNVEGLDW
ncbi:hypothetical protein [Neptuniibacter sp. QD37_11]|uniref:hypothetical protein n=1 Tax=Neptuniibacter sp. QD37_11 TaxID=3398209 RepID=UPI0039F50520